MLPSLPTPVEPHPASGQGLLGIFPPIKFPSPSAPLHQRVNGREGWRRLHVKISRRLNPGCHPPSHVSLCPSSIHLAGFQNPVVEKDDNARCSQTLDLLAPFYSHKWGNFPWKSRFKACRRCVGETNNNHIIRERIPCSFLMIRSRSGSC